MDKYYRFAAYAYTQKRLLKKNWIQCPANNCQEIFHFPRQQTTGYFTCSTTHKKLCCQCLGDYHPMFKSCEEYRQSRDPTSNEVMARKVIDEQGWKQCPKCRIFVEKNKGCDHIACRCGHHFCYKCLGSHPNCKCKRGNPF